MINVGLPVEIEASRDVLITTLALTLRFILCYFNGFPGIVWANVSIGGVFIKRALIYQEDVGGLVINYVFTACYLTANLIGIHLILTKIGMIYIDAEVLREGNDSTLNNLEEGVVILKEQDMQVQFRNQAAIKVERKINDSRPDSKQDGLEQDKDIFATKN